MIWGLRRKLAEEGLDTRTDHKDGVMKHLSSSTVRTDCKKGQDPLEMEFFFLKKRKKHPGLKLSVGCVQSRCMTAKGEIRSLSKGNCTHLSSVRLIRILPSVENTIKDIRNCGLERGGKIFSVSCGTSID